METANQSDGAMLSGAPAPAGYVAQTEYIQTVMNVRLDAAIRSTESLLGSMNNSLTAMLASLKESMEERFHESELRHQQRFDGIGLRYDQRFEETDLRYQQRFDQQRQALTEATVATEKAVSASLEAAEKAVAKAETATEKRFDSVNEFRAQLRDQATTFIPRLEAEQRLTQLADRVEELRNRDAQRTGRSAGGSSLYGWIVGGIGALTAIIVVVAALLK